MNIEELAKRKGYYSNEELSYLINYFRDNYNIHNNYWADKAGINRRTIIRIRLGQTKNMKFDTRKKLTNIAKNLMKKYL